MNNISAFSNKKRVCSDQQFTRAKQNYPSSARLALYIFHVFSWVVPMQSLKNKELLWIGLVDHPCVEP